MFDRRVLKSRAKSVLSVSYWQTLAVMLLLSAAASIAGRLFALNMPQTVMLSSAASAVIFGIAMLMRFLLPLAASIFLIMPLQVGVNKFLLDYAKGSTPDIASIGYAFRNNYKRIALSLLMKELIIVAFILVPMLILGAMAAVFVVQSDIVLPAAVNTEFLEYIADSLAETPIAMLFPIVLYVFLIPSVIKVYDYYLVEYILAEDSSLSWREALGKSKQMMRGNRFATFILGLSFIGWQLLGILLCGVGAVFVTPYIMATDAQLYLELSGKSKFEL